MQSLALPTINFLVTFLTTQVALALELLLSGTVLLLCTINFSQRHFFSMQLGLLGVSEFLVSVTELLSNLLQGPQVEVEINCQLDC